MFFFQRCQFLLDVGAVPFINSLEFFGLIVVEGCIACGAGNGVAAQGEEMGRSRKAVHDFCSSHESAQGQAGADGFAHDDAVRNDAGVVFNGKEVACPPEALLHFFINEEDAVLFAEVVEFFHENGMGRKDACIALDGFNHHRCHFIGRHIGFEGGFDILHCFLFHNVIGHIVTIEGEMVNFRKERSHFGMHTGSAGGHGRGSVGISMVAVYKGNDFRPSCVGPGKFHSCIVAVGATVAEGNLGLHAAGIHGGQLFRIGNHGLIVGVGSGVLGAFLQLRFNGFGKNGIGASQIQGRGTGEEINIFIAVSVFQDFSLPAFHGKGIIGKVLAGSYHLFIPGYKV